MQENTVYEAIKLRVTITKDDFVLQEILSRTIKRNEFVKEAIFYWDYILRHSKLRTRFIAIRNEDKFIVDGLFPESYYANRCVSDMSLKKDYEESIALRFEIGQDEIALQEIFSRIVNRGDYIKEAIFEWDCLLNHSNVFISRFINQKDGTKKEWPSINGKIIQENVQSEYSAKTSSKGASENNIEISNPESSPVVITTGTVNTSSSLEESPTTHDATNSNIISDFKEKEDISTQTSSTIKTHTQPIPTPSTMKRGRKNGMKW